MNSKEILDIKMKLSWKLGNRWLGISHRLIELQENNQHSTDITIFPLYISLTNIFGRYAEVEIGINNICSVKFGISIG